MSLWYFWENKDAVQVVPRKQSCKYKLLLRFEFEPILGKNLGLYDTMSSEKADKHIKRRMGMGTLISDSWKYSVA